MKKVTEEWLHSANDDLLVIEKIASDEHLTHMIAFHAQQCIEKSCKAVIEEYEIGTVRIHNLERLFEIITDYLTIDADSALIQMLDKLYVESRYPGDLGLLPNGKPSVARALQFRDLARSICETITRNLKKAG